LQETIPLAVFLETLTTCLQLIPPISGPNISGNKISGNNISGNISGNNISGNTISGKELKVLIEQQIHPDVANQANRVRLFARRGQGGNIPQPRRLIAGRGQGGNEPQARPQTKDLLLRHPQAILILRPKKITNNDRDGQLTGQRTEQQSNLKIETTEMETKF
jgi:hypothetical protein